MNVDPYEYFFQYLLQVAVIYDIDDIDRTDYIK